ncbi:hypothetical protein [uncultured Imperialibacter sp.]|uniref:hypothetical protein n=1 Tax=uncultured Imperialibacter sp. TaxID=1672639 RepID=UPI0030DADC39
MDTIELNTKSLVSPQDIVQTLYDRKLKAGDHIIILTNEEELAFISVVNVVFLAIQKVMGLNVDKFGEKVIADIFDSTKDRETLEQDIEERYGISIEVKQTSDVLREDWANLASESLERAYGTEEPDYSDMLLMEPNPLYRNRTKE